MFVSPLCLRTLCIVPTMIYVKCGTCDVVSSSIRLLFKCCDIKSVSVYISSAVKWLIKRQPVTRHLSFIHLADAFIQSDFQYLPRIGFLYYL